MRLIKMTGGLGNQMFIYAFYLRMKKRHTNTRIDLSDMMHYNVHHGYEMHRVFNLPKTEFCINQPLKKVIEFLFFNKTRQASSHSIRNTYGLCYILKDSISRKGSLPIWKMTYVQPLHSTQTCSMRKPKQC